MNGQRPSAAKVSTRPVRRYVGIGGTIVLTIALVIEAVALLWLLVVFWPPAATAVLPDPPLKTNLIGQAIELDRDRSLLLVVIVAGAGCVRIRTALVLPICR